VELKWLRPVHPGDAIHIESEVISTRTSATRPQWGIAVTRTTGFNQKDQAVIEITSTVFLPRREAAAP
jgi:acyl dehydratase